MAGSCPRAGGKPARPSSRPSQGQHVPAQQVVGDRLLSVSLLLGLPHLHSLTFQTGRVSHGWEAAPLVFMRILEEMELRTERVWRTEDGEVLRAPASRGGDRSGEISAHRMGDTGPGFPWSVVRHGGDASHRCIDTPFLSCVRLPRQKGPR